MAVAHDASSKCAAWSSSTNSISWTHTPVGTPRGVIVFVITDGSSSTLATTVTYGGVALDPVGQASDTAGEPGNCAAFFLGVGVPSGVRTVTVNRTNNAAYMWATAATVTAGTSFTEALGVVTLDNEGDISEQLVDDGSPGTNSLRYAGLYWGSHTTIPGPGSSSTALQSQGDTLPSAGAAMVRETTAGQGSRNVGFSLGLTDDRAAVHFAVKQAVVHSGIVSMPQTFSGSAVGWRHRYAQVALPLTTDLLIKDTGSIDATQTVTATVLGTSTRFGSASLGLVSVGSVFMGYKPLPNPWKGIPYVGPLIEKMQDTLASTAGQLAGMNYYTGIGEPNGVVPAPVGSLYTDQAGSTNTTLWVKEVGDDDMGWVAK